MTQTGTELMERPSDSLSKTGNSAEKLIPPTEGPFEVTDIMKVIPHRYPFLLIDRILELVPGHSIKAIKNVSMNEPFFQGHFPDAPVMPGVLQIEAMAQCGAFLVKKMFGEDSDKIAVLTGVDNFRFRKVVKPGDQLVFEGHLDKIKGPFGKALCKAYVNGELASSGEILFSLVERAQVL